MPKTHTETTKQKMSVSHMKRWQSIRRSKAQQTRRELERKHKRTIPVYEGDRLVGVLTRDDSPKEFCRKLDESQKVRPVAPRIITKQSKSTLRKTMEFIGCLPMLLLVYLLGFAVYGWLQTGVEITGKVNMVEAKEVTPVVEEIKVEEVEVTEVVEPTLEDYICSKDWECEIAKAVLTSENFNWNCEAVNTHNFDGSVDKGLWQVNSVHGKTDSDLFDCYKNTDIAYEIYQSQGWNAWTGYWRGNYKKYL